MAGMGWWLRFARLGCAGWAMPARFASTNTPNRVSYHEPLRKGGRQSLSEVNESLLPFPQGNVPENRLLTKLNSEDSVNGEQK